METREGAIKEILKHSGGTNPEIQIVGIRAVKKQRLLTCRGDRAKQISLLNI